jgi:hypothetical protein
MRPPGAGRLSTGHRNPQIGHLLLTDTSTVLTDTGTVQVGSTGLRDYDEDPLPFPMAIVSVMVPVLVVRCHLIGTRTVPTRMCLRLRHRGQKVYGGQQGESRAGEQ